MPSYLASYAASGNIELRARQELYRLSHLLGQKTQAFMCFWESIKCFIVSFSMFSLKIIYQVVTQCCHLQVNSWKLCNWVAQTNSQNNSYCFKAGYNFVLFSSQSCPWESEVGHARPGLWCTVTSYKTSVRVPFVLYYKPPRTDQLKPVPMCHSQLRRQESQSRLNRAQYWGLQEAEGQLLAALGSYLEA